MKIYKKTNLEAFQFTNESKDGVLFRLRCVNCNCNAIFDADNNPAILIYFSDNSEHEVHFTDWVILDEVNNILVELLTDEQFQKKYISKEEVCSI